MNNKRYLEQAMKTNDGNSRRRLCHNLMNEHLGKDIDTSQLIHSVLGLCGEAGEVSDIVKKHIFHERKLDTDHLKKELGDVLWYIALACDTLGTDFDELMQMNATKLANRYSSGGFTVEEANNRKDGDI